MLDAITVELVVYSGASPAWSQSVVMAARYSGTVLASLLSVGLLAGGVAPRVVVGASAVLPLLVLSLAWTLPAPRKARAAAAASSQQHQQQQLEHRDPEQGACRAIGSKLWHAARTLGRIVVWGQAPISVPLWPILLCVFVIRAAPTTLALFGDFLLESPSILLTNTQFSILSVVQSAGSLAGSALYVRYLAPRSSLWRIVVATGAVAALAGLTRLVLATGAATAWVGQPSVAWVVYIDGLLVGTLRSLAYLPLVVLAAGMAVPGVEAVVFAGVASLADVASSVSDAIAAAVTAATGVTAANWSNLWVVIIICAAAQLLALLAVLPVRKRVDAIAAVMPRAQQAVPAVI